jgi:hypothetical protein
MPSKLPVPRPPYLVRSNFHRINNLPAWNVGQALGLPTQAPALAMQSFIHPGDCPNGVV